MRPSPCETWSSVPACPPRQSTTTNGSDCSRHRIAGANRFVYDDRHIQALRLIRLLRERRRLGLATIGDPAAAPRPGRAGVPGAHVGERDRHRRGRHHDRGPGPHRRRRVPGVLDPWVRERSVADIWTRSAWARARSTSFASKENLFVAAACALVDDLVAALDARRPGHPLAPRPSPPSSTARSVTKPLLVEAALRGVHGKPEERRGAHAMPRRRSVTQSPADCARHPPRTRGWPPGSSSRPASAAPWQAWSPRRRSPDPAAIAPLARGRRLHTMIWTTGSEILDITRWTVRLDDTVLRERSAQENFPVAPGLAAPVRSHLLAIYGFARVVDDTATRAGDRMGALDGLEDQLDRAYRVPPRTPPSSASPRRSASWTSPTRRSAVLIEANRVDQVVTATTPGRRCATTARCRRTRSGGSCWPCSGPPRPSGSRCPTTSAPRCSWSSTCRTSARTMPAAGSTCPPRTSSASASPRPSWRRAAASAPAPRGRRAFEVDARPAVCCDPRRRARVAASRVGRAWRSPGSSAAVSPPSTRSGGPATTCSPSTLSASPARAHAVTAALSASPARGAA